MAKQGRPGISYEKFVEVWEKLVDEGRSSINGVIERLGGSKSTIVAFRERYEREKTSKALSVIRNVDLTVAVQQAIGKIKVKEITILEKENEQLKSRMDEDINTLNQTEDKLLSAKIDLAAAKADFDATRLALEKQLFAAQAGVKDMKDREKKLNEKYEKLNNQYNQAKQDAAVAKKEVEMLRKLKSA